MARKRGITRADHLMETAQVLAHIEGAAAYQAAVKQHRAALKHPSDGNSKHFRRCRGGGMSR